MSRILLADHSPHAQRMGERILRDEGYEVATVTDGETVLLRLKDLSPDVILADISLPGRTGYEVCEYVKSSGRYPQTRVVLTAGPVTAYDEARAVSAGSDGFVRKPFEASALLKAIQPLLEKPEGPPTSKSPAVSKTAVQPSPIAAPPPPPVPRPLDREQVRAAVILALEASLITMIESITDKVIVALEADARVGGPAPKIAAKAAAAAQPAAATLPAARAQESLASQPPAQTAPPEEPVVRVRTPVFRTLS